MKKLLSVLMPVFIIGLVFTSCQTSKTASTAKLLKFNLENGKGYDYEMVMDMDQNMGGMKNSITMTSNYGMDVIKEEAGVRTISTKFNSFRMNMSVMGMNINVDTEKPVPSGGDPKNPLDMMNRLFSGIKNAKFEMKVNADGKVLEVTGLENMMNAIVDSLGLPEKEKAEAKKAFEQQFNEEGMKSQFESAFFIFPNKEVKVGDTWEKTTGATSTMPISMVNTYKVDEIDGDLVTLDVKSQVKSDKGDVKGSQKGKMVVDSRSGLIVSANTDLDITTTEEGQTISIRAVSRIKGRAR